MLYKIYHLLQLHSQPHVFILLQKLLIISWNYFREVSLKCTNPHNLHDAYVLKMWANISKFVAFANWISSVKTKFVAWQLSHLLNNTRVFSVYYGKKYTIFYLK